MVELDLLIDGKDIIVENDDLKIGNAYDQNVYLVVTGAKGNYPKNRDIGYGLQSYMNAPVRRGELARGIRKELEKAGYRISNVIPTKDGIRII